MNQMRMDVQVTVNAAARTDIGRVRRQNQDAFGLDKENLLYVVCDGMGGAAGGEVASQLAVEAFMDEFQARAGRRVSADDAKNSLFYASVAANNAVQLRAAAEPALRGMGSTLVAAHFAGERLLLANVGDSRAYLIRRGEIAQLTQDHSFLDEQVRAGRMTQAMADASHWQSVITRAVGIDPSVKPDLFGVDLQDGDLVLLSSDGLTRHVKDKEIAAIVNADGELSARLDVLIKTACTNGGSDNITCVLLEVRLS